MQRWILLAVVVASALVWSVIGDRRPEEVPEAREPAPRERGPVTGSGSAADEGGESPSALAPLRIERLEEIHPPTGPLLAIHEELVERAASGDAVAAYKLYRALRYCRSAAASAADLEARIEHLRTTRRIGAMPVEDPAPIVAEYRERFRYCEGVTDEMEDEFYGWLRYSAELGLLQAMIRMGAEAHPESWHVDIEDPANAPRVAELRADWVGWQQRAAAAGSVEAMRALSHSYQRGVVIEQDLERAYAYQLAALTAREAAGVNVALDRRRLERLEAELRPWQVESARRRAEEVLADPVCCKL